ncbi:response regulator transcription factor [Marmoricola sp. URHB0036]|uniref:response regulator transcription factor n=1 Tax=Marmoricola sp. URHB0036 TaxID=1298863 RepID=UPI0003F8F8E5|nr:response regulator transcription factor [Marmoricola sp. URHB0036]
MAVRVLLVDDEAMFRAGIAMVLGSQADLEVVGETGDGAEVVARVAELGPDVVLMDVQMSRVDGVAATRALVEHFGDDCPKILVLTTFDLDEAAAAAIEAGASGFLLKSAQPDFLLAAVRAVASGNQVVAAGATRQLWERFRARPTLPPGPEYAALTEREQQILQRTAQGLSNAEIAEQEFLAVGTVKTHVSRILTKLDLRDRVQLVIYAYQHGLI